MLLSCLDGERIIFGQEVARDKEPGLPGRIANEGKMEMGNPVSQRRQERAKVRVAEENGKSLREEKIEGTKRCQKRKKGRKRSPNCLFRYGRYNLKGNSITNGRPTWRYWGGGLGGRRGGGFLGFCLIPQNTASLAWRAMARNDGWLEPEILGYPAGGSPSPPSAA